jgi:hypothetical protein
LALGVFSLEIISDAAITSLSHIQHYFHIFCKFVMVVSVNKKYVSNSHQHVIYRGYKKAGIYFIFYINVHKNAAGILLDTTHRYIVLFIPTISNQNVAAIISIKSTSDI